MLEKSLKIKIKYNSKLGSFSIYIPVLMSNFKLNERKKELISPVKKKTMSKLQQNIILHSRRQTTRSYTPTFFSAYSRVEYYTQIKLQLQQFQLTT